MRTPVILVCAATAALYFFIPFINAELLELFAREDQLVEWTGALAYLGASTMALLAFVASAGQPNRFFGLATKRNFFMLLLAVLFFFAFGEEISWGQRIFGWVTPREYGKLNLQGETNLHNLWLFHVTVWDGNLKSSLQHLLHTNRLISMFWMA
ncbi:MAG TPA: hypothetical protein VK934_13065, partial [Fimbriimonas sp.]|nr:hypothetical protein [Fimbriimonas sp.]